MVAGATKAEKAPFGGSKPRVRHPTKTKQREFFPFSLSPSLHSSLRCIVPSPSKPSRSHPLTGLCGCDDITAKWKGAEERRVGCVASPLPAGGCSGKPRKLLFEQRGEGVGALEQSTGIVAAAACNRPLISTHHFVTFLVSSSRSLPQCRSTSVSARYRRRASS